MNEHEEQFTRSFVVVAKRERYLTLLAKEKTRSKVAHGLNHTRDLDMRFATAVPPAQQNAEAIARILRSKGAPERCHVMSSDSAVDGLELELDGALAQIVGYGSGTLVSCIPGKLAYFEYEDPGMRYILERRPGT